MTTQGIIGVQLKQHGTDHVFKSDVCTEPHLAGVMKVYPLPVMEFTEELRKWFTSKLGVTVYADDWAELKGKVTDAVIIRYDQGFFDGKPSVVLKTAQFVRDKMVVHH